MRNESSVLPILLIVACSVSPPRSEPYVRTTTSDVSDTVQIRDDGPAVALRLSQPDLPEGVLDRLVVGGFGIAMNQTTLHEAVAVLGGTIAHLGDASASTRWVCYEQQGRAALWLGASSLGGPMGEVTEFVFAMNPDSGPSSNCVSLPADSMHVEIEHGLRLGMSESEFGVIFAQEVRQEGSQLLKEWSGDYELSPGGGKVDYYAGVAATIQDTRVVSFHGWLTQTRR